ncbi:zinc-dependent alcohol dehydrogenase family protein [Ferviditalea candida]|uniref:Zinc-dependent alcohol dehydrogenase family protein n=1 Tax=Ferviditalea candida TaxID=3108399 RepID=A0ABU5ZLZ6_9BACL|nr:zinc-dependent alcohol dehydrogenase family protein [Paenibacillaceae bacterium T2]
MKAIVIDQFGGPDVFRQTELPDPEPIPGHIVIRAAATSVNPIDYKVRNGFVPAFAPAFPAVLHGDIAGVVEAVGPGVTKFKPGDEVYACAGGFTGLPGGALAEYMLADEALAALKPKTLSMSETAALPLVSITAWEALFDRAQLHKGQHVLVHAGAGGVGHIALQLAKWAGARVAATVSDERKAEIAKNFGADEIIMYRREGVSEYVDRLTGSKGFDIVFDTVGGENLDRSFEAAREGGTVVNIAARSTHNLAPMHQKALSLHVVLMLLTMIRNRDRQKHGDILARIAALADEGRIKPLIDERRFHITEAGEAHAYAESGRAVGKVVISHN